MSHSIRRVFALLTILALTALAAGCTDHSSGPTTPTTPSLNLSGTWGTTITFLDISARMTWGLTQLGTGVTGPVTIALPTGAVLLNGFFTGTLTGTALDYTISVAPGGIPLQPTCAGQLKGTLTATATTLTGPMNLTSSTCTSPITSQNLTMTKQ